MRDSHSFGLFSCYPSHCRRYPCSSGSQAKTQQLFMLRIISVR